MLDYFPSKLYQALLAAGLSLIFSIFKPHFNQIHALTFLFQGKFDFLLSNWLQIGNNEIKHKVSYSQKHINEIRKMLQLRMRHLSAVLDNPARSMSSMTFLYWYCNPYKSIMSPHMHTRYVRRHAINMAIRPNVHICAQLHAQSRKTVVDFYCCIFQFSSIENFGHGRFQPYIRSWN